MALKYIDSFDHYDTANILDKWTDDGGFSPTLVAGAGRCGSQAMHVTVFNEVSKGIPFGSSTTTIGFAIKLDAFLGVNFPMSILAIGNSFADNFLLIRTSDGSVNVFSRDGASSTFLGATPPDTLRNDTYYFLECKSLLHASAGTVELRVNGVVVLTITGVDLLPSGGATTPTRVTFYGNGNQGYYIDDFYALDDTGGDSTTYLGDVRCELLQTDGVGIYTDFDVVGSANGWDAVNDGAVPNDDVDYIWSNTLNEKSTFTFADTGLPTPGTVLGLQLSILARKTDAGPRGLSPVIRSGGSDYVGTEQYPSAASYRYLHQAWGINPVSSVAWDIATVNAVEAGVKVTT